MHLREVNQRSEGSLSQTGRREYDTGSQFEKVMVLDRLAMLYSCLCCRPNAIEMHF
jgi:hypothetical protein